MSNNLKSRFKEKKGSAGCDWSAEFLRRNPEITLGKPKSTSVNRVTVFLQTLIEKLFPARIFNGSFLISWEKRKTAPFMFFF